MTRDEALSLYAPKQSTYDTRHATGTNGERWFHTHWAPSRNDHGTSEILWNGRFLYWVEADTDPPGTEWVPDLLSPPEGALAVTDPAVEIPNPSDRQSLPPGMKRMCNFEPRVMRHGRGTPREEFAIHEVYCTQDGEAVTYTEDALSPRASSIEGLRRALLELLRSGKADITCGDLGYSYAPEDAEQWLSSIEQPPVDYQDES
ncbi:MAG TPA: hypothetical protein VK689_15805 [Armatimonadota bacterium]|nr:hypothetical protein [Armatimonadota bacterium]